MTHEQIDEIANVNAFTLIINTIRAHTNCDRVELFNSTYDEHCFAILIYDDLSIDCYYCNCVYDIARFFDIHDYASYIDVDVNDAYNDARIS
jgi:hypothetical protein